MFAYCHGIYFVASKEIMGISRTSESLLFCIIFLFPGNSCWENYSSINRHDSIEPIKSELNCSISFRKKSYLTWKPGVMRYLPLVLQSSCSHNFSVPLKKKKNHLSFPIWIFLTSVSKHVRSSCREKKSNVSYTSPTTRGKWNLADSGVYSMFIVAVWGCVSYAGN